MKKIFRGYGGLLALVAVGMVAFSATPEASAEGGFDLQQFSPMPNVAGNFWSTSSADVTETGKASATLFFNYSNDPLVRRDVDGDHIDSLVGHQGTAHVLLSMGVADHFELGLDIPVVLFQSGSDLPGTTTDLEGAGLGIGDLRLIPKAQLVSTREHDDDDGIAFAVLIDTRLPTGNDEALRGGDFRIGPRLAFDGVFNGIRTGANLGYTYRSETEFAGLTVRDTVDWNVAAQAPVHDAIDITTEVNGRITPGADEFRSLESPLEWILGAKYGTSDIAAFAGAGLGVTKGYGTPRFRTFVGMSWNPQLWDDEPEPEPTPEPEPEPEPECTSQTVEDDCPDVAPTNCEEGVLHVGVAQCVEGECHYEVSEEPCDAGFECGDIDGEPACVEEPECQSDDHCTDVPAPSCEDGVLTTYQGTCTDDGTCDYVVDTEVECAEDEECGRIRGRASCVQRTDRVEVDEETERIEILEMIQFETGSDAITSESQSIVDEVAQVMENHPEIELVRIEGHTDNVGAHGFNVQLSDDRAQSVRRALIDRGIDEDRLTAVGKGPDEPIADNDTPAGRAENRRVEFHIEVWSP